MNGATLETADKGKRKRKRAPDSKICVQCGAIMLRGTLSCYSRRTVCSFECFNAHKRYTPEKALAVFWSRVDKNAPGGCWLYMGGRDKWGYGDLRWEKKHVQAHRLAWRLLKGEPGDMDVLHTCHNPPCCNPDHLYLGTDLENARDRVAAGRHARGENTRNKLTEEQAKAIKALAWTVGSTTLSRQYGVTSGTIRAIWHGRSWTHI